MLIHTYAPFPTSEPGAYALVGMGALFAGIILLERGGAPRTEPDTEHA